jgi:hypothetical protein
MLCPDHTITPKAGIKMAIILLMAGLSLAGRAQSALCLERHFQKQLEDAFGGSVLVGGDLHGVRSPG